MPICQSSAKGLWVTTRTPRSFTLASIMGWILVKPTTCPHSTRTPRVVFPNHPSRYPAPAESFRKCQTTKIWDRPRRLHIPNVKHGRPWRPHPTCSHRWPRRDALSTIMSSAVEAGTAHPRHPTTTFDLRLIPWRAVASRGGPPVTRPHLLLRPDPSPRFKIDTRHTDHG